MFQTDVLQRRKGGKPCYEKNVGDRTTGKEKREITEEVGYTNTLKEDRVSEKEAMNRRVWREMICCVNQ